MDMFAGVTDKAVMVWETDILDSGLLIGSPVRGVEILRQRSVICVFFEPTSGHGAVKRDKCNKKASPISH